MVSPTSSVKSLMASWMPLYQSLETMIETIKPSISYLESTYQEEPAIRILAGNQLVAIVTPTPEILDLFIFLSASVKKTVATMLHTFTALQRLTWEHATDSPDGTRIYFPISDESSLKEALVWLRLVLSHLKS